MSAKLRAGRTFPYVLTSERNQELADQFKLKVLSADADSQISEIRGQWLEIAAIENDVQRLKAASQKPKLLQQMLSLAVQTDEGDVLTSSLTEMECWELINAATEGASLSAEERKKYVSPVQSDKESTASGV